MWYEFNQNNSGGSFVVDEQLCHRVFIEADSETEANDRAEAMGIYFNGCDLGMDCSCCGDRWYQAEALKFPIEHDGTYAEKDLESYVQMLANKYGWTKPDARLFYKNGTVKEIFTQKG